MIDKRRLHVKTASFIIRPLFESARMRRDDSEPVSPVEPVSLERPPVPTVR